MELTNDDVAALKAHAKTLPGYRFIISERWGAILIRNRHNHIVRICYSLHEAMEFNGVKEICGACGREREEEVHTDEDLPPVHC